MVCTYVCTIYVCSKCIQYIHMCCIFILTCTYMLCKVDLRVYLHTCIHTYVLCVCMYVGVGMGGLSVLIDIRMYVLACTCVKSCWIHIRTCTRQSHSWGAVQTLMSSLFPTVTLCLYVHAYIRMFNVCMYVCTYVTYVCMYQCTLPVLQLPLMYLASCTVLGP